MIFSKFYDNTTPFEAQIIRYLIEDLFTPHYHFEKQSVIDIGLNVRNSLKPIKAEIPVKSSINHKHFAEIFRNYGIFDVDFKVLNQIKAPHNKRNIEIWKPSNE